MYSQRVGHIFTIHGDMELRIDLEDEAKENGWSIVCKRLFIEKYKLDETIWEIRVDPMWGENAILHSVICSATR